jgi:hypothetical protein
MGGWLIVGMLASSCRFQGSGVVEPAARGEGVELRLLDGGAYVLRLSDGTEPLGYLDGHIVQVAGRRVGRKVKVERWSIVEGLSGMPVYVGIVRRQGEGVALIDRQTGETWGLDPTASATLASWIGKVVLVEGYATGPSQLTTTAWRPLDTL